MSSSGAYGHGNEGGAHRRSSSRNRADVKRLEHAFKLFSSKYGGMPNSTEKMPLATNADIRKWCLDAGVLDGSLTSPDVDIAFAAIKMRGSKYLTMDDMPRFIDSLASKYMVTRRCDREQAKSNILEKLAHSDFKLHGTTDTSNADPTGRLTQLSHYTGTQGHRGTIAHFENYRQESRKERP